MQSFKIPSEANLPFLPPLIFLEAVASQHILIKQLSIGCQQSDIRMEENRGLRGLAFP
jgi:hypothetical protein